MARRDGEGIYRRITVRMHGDEKVRRLSPEPPSGRGLWWHLLAGDQTGIIPGLFKIGEGAFAEQLGWPLTADPEKGIPKGFRECFEEVVREGMAKADWNARLVFVFNAVTHNFPQSPNVIVHWRETWELLPECDLKLEAWRHVRGLFADAGEAWVKAFDKACPKPFKKVSANQGSGNREQVAGRKDSPATPSPAEPTKSKPSPEQEACRAAIKARFLAEWSKRSNSAPEDFRWLASENVAIVTLAALDGAGGVNPAKGVRALETFIERMPVKNYYATNFAPRIVVQELNNLRLPVVADGAPRARAPGAASGSRPVASAADFEEAEREYQDQLKKGGKP